ncbi:MAG: hypothetical protein J7K83_03800, partial [Candidatus Aenigmarchaeota archaeon]|nr:hypothetical protein [Candidatus Aenigmarchaeota archaeon]
FIGEATEVKTTDGLILLKRLDEAVKEEFPYVFGIGEKLEEAKKLKSVPPKHPAMDVKFREFTKKILGKGVPLFHLYGDYPVNYAKEHFNDYVIERMVEMKVFFYTKVGVPF